MILVFKTNVSSVSQIEILQPILDTHLKNSDWNFDLEDCDKILRIDTHMQETVSIVRLLEEAGFRCEELTY